MIRGTLGDIDPLNKVPFKRATSRVQKGPPLRGLPYTTPKSLQSTALLREGNGTGPEVTLQPLVDLEPRP